MPFHATRNLELTKVFDYLNIIININLHMKCHLCIDNINLNIWAYSLDPIKTS